MRANQSSTAFETYRRADGRETWPGGFAPRAAAGRQLLHARAEACEVEAGSVRKAGEFDRTAETFQRDGLLHDARNLVSAIGLYCDLLSMPGVLRQEHRKYADELRLLSTRCEEMIEHVMDSLPARQMVQTSVHAGLLQQSDAYQVQRGRAASQPRTYQPSYRAEPVSLRAVVDRCSGLLSRVANGRAIEVHYGPAADVPIRIAEDALERILVNLVRNGSAALGEGKAAIRISVGVLGYAVGEEQPWPFERVRLVVEDAGCGMEADGLQALLSGRGGSVQQGNHGIGFRVVRELVSASNGELRAASARGIGTRIQIEWPMAGTTASGRGNGGIMSEQAPGTEQHPAVVKAIRRATAEADSGDRAAREERQAH